MTKLYQVIGSEPAEFGTLLARNSVGDFVLEMKGLPQSPRSFKEKELELVVPHTVRIKHVSSSTAFDIEVPKGCVERHDLILNASGMYVVVNVDTRSQKTTKFASFRKFKGEVVELANGVLDADED